MNQGEAGSTHAPRGGWEHTCTKGRLGAHMHQREAGSTHAEVRQCEQELSVPIKPCLDTIWSLACW